MVRLCGGDLDLLVSRLGLSGRSELRSRGLVRLVREAVGGSRQIWRPRLRFRTHPLVQCPFLVNEVTDEGGYRGLCSLHPEHKPLVCALSPLGRTLETTDAGTRVTWTFVPPVEGCPGVGKGPSVPLRTPHNWKARLAAEAAWLKRWTEVSSGFADENQAWSRVEAV